MGTSGKTAFKLAGLVDIVLDENEEDTDFSQGAALRADVGLMEAVDDAAFDPVDECIREGAGRVSSGYIRCRLC